MRKHYSPGQQKKEESVTGYVGDSLYLSFITVTNISVTV